MSESFVLSCESTVDLPYSLMEKRGIPVLFYSYSVDGKDYTDDMLRDPEALPRFYQFLEEGKIPTTSQINEFAYEEFFEKISEAGKVLHLAFGTGMTKSFYNAEIAAKKVMKKYSDRKITVIDSLCSSSGYGMLVNYAADLRDEGKSIEEIQDWVLAHRKRIHHQFFSTEMKYYRRSGRISGAAATVATILDICPIMRLDDKGRIIVYDKVRGKAKAVQRTIDTMERHADHGKEYSGKCYICHSNCLKEAERTKDAVAERFPNLAGKIEIYDIGTIIAAHCGPGTVAVFFLGDERAPE